jgi:hypothetical protein
MRAADPGALWWWLRGTQVEQLLTPDLRQATLDVFELGADAAAFLAQPDGGAGWLTGYHPALGVPPALAALLERVARRTPGTRPRAVR